MEERDRLIRENPDYGVIICRCEEISKGKILDALNSPLPVCTVDGIKKSVTYQNRCQKEDLSENKRIVPGYTGKPRNIKGFCGILYLKKAHCDTDFEKIVKILCHVKAKMENPTMKCRKG